MNYAGLQTAVANFLNKSDLYATIPTFIALAEARMNRRLRVRPMVVNSTASVTLEFETVPADFAGPISMRLSTGEVLDCIAPDAMAARKSGGDKSAAKPICYSVVGASFEFSPTPNAAYTVNLVYYATLPALTALATSNWLLAAYPDAYLYGALAEAAPYAGDSRSGMWSQRFEAALAEIDNADRQEGYGARLEPRTSLVV